MVAIRKRPLTRKEVQKGERDIVQTDSNVISIAEEREKLDLTKYTELHRYRFDRVYGAEVSTEEVR